MRQRLLLRVTPARGRAVRGLEAEPLAAGAEAASSRQNTPAPAPPAGSHRRWKPLSWVLTGASLAAAAATLGYLLSGGELRVTLDGRLESRVVMWQRVDRYNRRQYVLTVPMVHVASRPFYEEVCLMCRGSTVLKEGITVAPAHPPPPLFRAACTVASCLWGLIVDTLLALAWDPMWHVVCGAAGAAYRLDCGPRRAEGYLVTQSYFDWLALLTSPSAETADVSLPEAQQARLPLMAWTSYDFLIRDRNARLLRRLDEMPWRRSVVLPWGAAHMPGLADGLLRRGYAPIEARWVAVASLPDYAAHKWHSIRRQVSDVRLRIEQEIDEIRLKQQVSW